MRDGQVQDERKGYMVRARFAAVLVWVITQVLPGPARAQEATRLSWHAPAGCPDAEVVRKRVLSMHEGSSLPPVRLDARVLSDERGYTMALTVHDDRGERRQTYRALRCATLVDLLGLQLSWMEAPAAVVARADAEPHLAMRALVGAGEGPTPSWSLRSGLSVFVLLRRLQLELLGSYDLRRTQRHPKFTSAGASFEAVTLQTRGCLVSRVGWLELPACGGLEFGVIRGQGAGVRAERTVSRGTLALVLAQQLRFPAASAWALLLEAGAFLSLYRPAFIVEQLSGTYRPGLLGFRGSLGVELHFR